MWVGGCTTKIFIIGLSPLQDLTSRRWYKLPDMPGKKKSCQAVHLKKWLVVLSGHDGNKACKRVFAFDTLSQVWQDWKATPYAQCAAASDGERLFIAGGNAPAVRGREDAVGDVYQLSDSHDDWVVISALPRPCCECAGTILNGKFYIIGTIACRDFSVPRYAPRFCSTTSVQVFDLEKHTWAEITISSSPEARFLEPISSYCFTTLGNLLVTDALVTYDVEKQESSNLPFPPLPDQQDGSMTLGHGIVEVTGRLLTCGGGRYWMPLACVFVLSEDHSRWVRLSDMQVGRSLASACTVNNVLYVVGGHVSNTPLSNAECFR